MPTPYEVLGLPATASQEDIRHAYRRLVKAAHPDRAGDAEQFQRITDAYAVLSDPARRAAYDRALRPTPLAASPATSPARRPRSGRYAILLVVAVVAGGAGWIVVATTRQSVGDACVVGTWRGEAFEVPFHGSVDGTDVAAPVNGGAGVIVTVHSDGTVRADYSRAALFSGSDGPHRIEGVYRGSTIERWRAVDGRMTQSDTDTSRLRFEALINGREPDQPLDVTVVDSEDPYTCTPTTLQVGPYRYTRV